VQLSNSFRIARPVPEVFEAFLDVQRVAGCMPGSRLLGKSGEDTYDGEVKVKVGPLSVSYAGQLTLLDVDRERWSMTLRAQGREQRGAGNADALVQAILTEADTGTLVELSTDLNIRGKVAQFGRGVIGEVTDGIMQTFASNVETMLAGSTPSAAVRTADDSQRPPRPSSAGTESSAEGLDLWSVVGRPLLQRHGRQMGVALILAVITFVGVRALTRGHAAPSRGH
jgi:carbon monoxide dehydrogenase subunit G